MTTLTAGRIGKELKLPADVAVDMQHIVRRRNAVAHHAWNTYLAARERHPDTAAEDYCTWLEEQSAALGHAYDGLMDIVRDARRIAPDSELVPVSALEIWRRSVREPVKPLGFPAL